MFQRGKINHSAGELIYTHIGTPEKWEGSDEEGEGQVIPPSLFRASSSGGMKSLREPTGGWGGGFIKFA